jgi:hypothetical protein
MVTFQAVWYVLMARRHDEPPVANRRNRSNIGSIIVSVMMQQLNQKHPDNYLLAMRILWAPIGLMIVFWALVPESPWFHARHGDKEKALKAMHQLYGGVKGYDFEEEYGIIEKTIAHERDVLQEAPSVLHVFKGLNRVCISSLSEQMITADRGIEKNPHRDGPLCISAACWSCHHLHILYL